MAKRQYQNDYPSVTQILSVLRKIGLEKWFQWHDGKWCNKESARGRLVGTQIHDVIQQYIQTGNAKIETEYDEEVTNALKSFMLFKKENPGMSFSLAEIPLTSQEHCYNGTLDAPHPPVLYDWKTSTCKDNDKPAIYDEHKYQCSFYVHLWNENNPEKIITQACIVCLAKDKVAYDIYCMSFDEIKDCFDNVCLPTLSIYNYQKRRKYAAKT